MHYKFKQFDPLEPSVQVGVAKKPQYFSVYESSVPRRGKRHFSS
jgi:hypothetical protein